MPENDVAIVCPPGCAAGDFNMVIIEGQFLFVLVPHIKYVPFTTARGFLADGEVHNYPPGGAAGDSIMQIREEAILLYDLSK